MLIYELNIAYSNKQMASSKICKVQKKNKIHYRMFGKTVDNELLPQPLLAQGSLGQLD